MRVVMIVMQLGQRPLRPNKGESMLVEERSPGSRHQPVQQVPVLHEIRLVEVVADAADGLEIPGNQVLRPIGRTARHFGVRLTFRSGIGKIPRDATARVAVFSNVVDIVR